MNYIKPNQYRYVHRNQSWTVLLRPAQLYSAPLAGPGPPSPTVRCAPPSRAGGRTGLPAPRCDCRMGRTFLSAPQPRRAARAGLGPCKRRQGSARDVGNPPDPSWKYGPRSLTPRASQRLQWKWGPARAGWGDSDDSRANSSVGRGHPGSIREEEAAVCRSGAKRTAGEQQPTQWRLAAVAFCKRHWRHGRESQASHQRSVWRG